MKLLLTSAGISNASIHAALVELLSKPVGEANALFVPTAIYAYPGGGNIARRVICGTLGDPFCETGWKSMGLLEPLEAVSTEVKHVPEPGHSAPRSFTAEDWTVGRTSAQT